MAVLHLQRGDLHLTLAPHIGGAIAEFFSYVAGHRRDFLRPASQAAMQENDARALASFPLLPFCNRIRDSRFCFHEHEYRLAANLPPSPHAIHGIGWQSVWTLVAQTKEMATIRFDYNRDEAVSQGAWPWHFRAEQAYGLRDDGLQVKMRLQNRSSCPMPFGIGHHPYFLKTADTRLRVHAQAMWDNDIECLPIQLIHAPVIDDLSTGVAVDTLDLDNNFIGWNGYAKIDDGASKPLQLQADPRLAFLTLYTPKNADFFCVEPVSNCTDSFNLKNRGLSSAHTGGDVLLPDQWVETCWSLSV